VAHGTASHARLGFVARKHPARGSGILAIASCHALCLRGGAELGGAGDGTWGDVCSTRAVNCAGGAGGAWQEKARTADVRMAGVDRRSISRRPAYHPSASPPKFRARIPREVRVTSLATPAPEKTKSTTARSRFGPEGCGKTRRSGRLAARRAKKRSEIDRRSFQIHPCPAEGWVRGDTRRNHGGRDPVRPLSAQ
jgi:hypothetical protein